MVRFIPKQFAENSTTSVVFGSHQEQGGNPHDGTISSDPATLQGGAAWPLGWSAATDNFFQIPRGEEMEGLERVLSAAIIQQFKDGLTFWQSEMPVTQYQTIVQYQTGSDLPKLYINITGTSTSTPPDSDTINWFMFCDTAQVLANVSLTNSPYTTNRILEIPQDIKLELNNGTLTLKAGSKVYVPNGFEEDGTTPKFDVVTIENDLTPAVVVPNNNDFMWLSVQNGQVFNCNEITGFSSGLAANHPSIGIYYATDTNVFYLNNSIHKMSFPFGIVTGGSSSLIVTSIDQIFNGFGYIGSTVFALPGLKGEFASGQNTNGTCITEIKTLDTVLTNTLSGTNPAYVALRLWNNNITLQHTYLYNVFFQQKMPSSTTNYVSWFDGIKWRVYYNGSWVENFWSLLVLAHDNFSSGKITSFLQCQVDSVANSNMSNISSAGRSYLSGLGMPSGRYIDLTLGVSGVGYIAPANGYFSLLKTATAASQYVILNSFFEAEPAKLCTMAFAPNSGYGVGAFIPARKGDKINISYTAAGNLVYFRFVYAEGEN